ncbi:MAG TPA: hypothetical protein VEC18_12085 [Myxococcota bacterium]|nr:hypothetical protein [Myxococcota bacterium]
MESIERRRLRNALAVGALSLWIGACAIAYPPLIELALSRFGVSGVASAMLLLLALSFALWGRRSRAAQRGGGAASAGVAALLVGAAASGRALYLELIPSVVYFGLAGWFAASLRARDSLVERAARWLVPEVPAFIRAYCRKLTAFWAIFFAASALAIAAPALAGDHEAWRFASGRLVLASMLAASLVEFLVRKTWFRYYFHRGWFDRLWEKIFPAHNTEQGRRSMEYIAEYWRQRNG